MNILLAGVVGFIGGVIGSWLTYKYGPVVILYYAAALIVLLVAMRFKF